MHPSVVQFDAPWNGYHYWMAMTPYTNYNGYVENPSILASNDGLSWVVPAGVENPVALNKAAQYADTQLLYDSASNELWLYYLDKTFPGIVRMRSSNGVNWSAAEHVLGAPALQCLSPAVEKSGSTYYMWLVDTPSGWNSTSSKIQLHTSSDGKNWSAPQTAEIDQPGYVIWHIDVSWVPSKSEFWMLLASYPVGTSSGNTSLFFARSSDGLHWTTYRRPILWASGSGWDSGEIYRSTFVYDEPTDKLRIWYSAESKQTWHTGYTECNYTALLSWLEP